MGRQVYIYGVCLERWCDAQADLHGIPGCEDIDVRAPLTVESAATLVQAADNNEAWHLLPTVGAVLLGSTPVSTESSIIMQLLLGLREAAPPEHEQAYTLYAAADLDRFFSALRAHPTLGKRFAESLPFDLDAYLVVDSY